MIRLTTKAQLDAHLKAKTPGPIFIQGISDYILNRPVIEFGGLASENQGCGIKLEGCRGFQIVGPRVYCTRQKSPMTGGEAYGCAVGAGCEGVVVRGGGIFDYCHSALMACDGAINTQFGDTDHNILLGNCWMVDIHSAATGTRFYNIKAVTGLRASIHIGNITPSLAVQPIRDTVVFGCDVARIEVVGNQENCKVYKCTAQEYRLRPLSGYPFKGVRIEGAGSAAVLTDMFEVGRTTP